MLTMHPFSTITHTAPQHTKAYKWASAIICYEANKRRFKQKVEREAWAMSEPVKGVSRLTGREKRPSLFKVLSKRSLLKQLLP